MGKTSRAVIPGSRLFNTLYRRSSLWKEYHEIFRSVPKRLASRRRLRRVADTPIRRFAVSPFRDLRPADETVIHPRGFSRLNTGRTIFEH
jgi:hypothetical protein